MSPFKDLLSCSVIEKDYNDDILWTWTFPTISKTQQAIVIRKCNVQTENTKGQSFLCVRHMDMWFYTRCSEVSDPDKLARVKQFALILFTRDFNHQKYEVLCRVMSEIYCKTGDPGQILKLYLSLFTIGTCTIPENGKLLLHNFNSHSFIADRNVRDLIKVFELETILIYTALLLKKRIIVYHHSLEELLKWMNTFPALMKHRRVTDNLFPWVDLVQDELTELEMYLYYVAGCRDSSILLKPELYDLLVNIPAREITIAPHAKESLTMTKTHKEIALFIVQLCENLSYSEVQIIDEIGEKTKDLVNQLKELITVEGFDGRKLVNFKLVREKNLSPAVENFLTSLAIAENLIVP